MKKTCALLILITSLIGCSVLNAAEPTPPLAPKRVLLSVDDTWFHRLGLSRFTYAKAVRKAGLIPVFVNFRVLDDTQQDRKLAESLLADKHGLILAGGGDVDPTLYGKPADFSLGVNPDRDRFELALLEYAEAQGLPVFAICRGAQLLNVVRGGTLRNLRKDPVLAEAHKRRWGGHNVSLTPGSRLSRWMQLHTIPRVTSYHGQAVDRLGSGLIVTGVSEDGVIEAIESELSAESDRVFGTVGVQWHPEVRTDDIQMKIFRAFANAVKQPTTE